MKDNVVPLSDMAGEIVALSEGVQGWKVGDRVSANVVPDHLLERRRLPSAEPLLVEWRSECILQVNKYEISK